MKYKRQFTHMTSQFSLVCLLLCSTLLASGIPSSIAVKATYHADHTLGYIGYHENQGYDNPRDNIFTINIANTIDPTSEAWLVYEVKGLADANSVTRSINDRLSTGGGLMNFNKTWNLQRERIDPQWLKKGKNQILFSSPELSKKIEYQIKNLRIEFTASTQERLNLSTEKVISNGGYVSIKGFITGGSNTSDQLYFDGRLVSIHDGEFELVTKHDLSAGQLELITKQGDKIKKTITIEQGSYPYQLNTLDYTTKTISKQANKALFHQINLAGATLEVDKSILKQNQTLSITSLRYQDLPSLDLGMVNVTAEHSGYRFLPHGNLFEKEALVKIKVDKHKLPIGYSLKDVKTYYFDLEDKVGRH